MTYTTTAIITGTQIRVERSDITHSVSELAFTEVRPASLVEADVALAAHGLGRIGEWDLGANGDVVAAVQIIDNQFNGVRAARLEQAVGTTHGELETAAVGTLENGDLIGALDDGPLYVVAGSNPATVLDRPAIRVHMVGECQTWADRFTTDFPAGQLVRVARRKV